MGLWARDEQLPPAGNWSYWLAMAGRGWGKTRTGAEWVRYNVETGRAGRIALIGRTVADVRSVMVEGDSGLLAVSPPWFKPIYNPSKRRLVYPNGAICTTFTSEKPDQLRGPEHDLAWLDEYAAWKYPQETWDQLMFGLRKGKAQVCITSTPRPTKAFLELVEDENTLITGGPTYENRANLADAFFSRIVKRFEGTRLGRQELSAEILRDVPGALWSLANLDAGRRRNYPPLIRVGVGVDPAGSSKKGTAETGIVVAGIGPCNCKGHTELHGFVLEDYSKLSTPTQWAGLISWSYNKHQADIVVGEVNHGGEMVGYTVLSVDPTINFKAIHASRGKYVRAEPISALYGQGKVHHIGVLAELEDQMTTWLPGEDSPDRMDALVWILTELFYGGENREDDLVVYDDPVTISEY